METLKKILSYIGTAIATIFLFMTGLWLLQNNKNKKIEIDKAENAREDKKNELEKKSPDDIAADSPNPDIISANIEREQQELRERVRNRLNKNIYRPGSSTDN